MLGWLMEQLEGGKEVVLTQFLSSDTCMIKLATM